VGGIQVEEIYRVVSSPEFPSVLPVGLGVDETEVLGAPVEELVLSD